MERMKRGRTIVAERERVESDSERMLARKRVRRKRLAAVVFVGVMLTLVVVLFIKGVKSVVGGYEVGGVPETVEYQITAEIVDEDQKGQISTRVKNYIGQLEQDFRDLGKTVRRVVLPAGTSRELYVDLEGEEVYFKINMDRGSAVSAEDAVRMLKYLTERDLKPEYVDVRIDGRAYYK